MDAAQRRLVGAALQQTRKLLGTGQDEIARVLDMSRGNVSWIETGRSELTLDQMQRLAAFWEMPLVTLAERLGFQMDRTAPKFDDWYRATSERSSATGTRPWGDTLRQRRQSGPSDSQGGPLLSRYGLNQAIAVPVLR